MMEDKKPDPKAVDEALEKAEEKFNSLKWLTDQVEQDFKEEKEARRIKRNKRKAIKAKSGQTTSTPNVRMRKLRPGRNSPCPCGAKKDDKPIKYKNCCGK
jgi:hypothetical protein